MLQPAIISAANATIIATTVAATVAGTNAVANSTTVPVTNAITITAVENTASANINSTTVTTDNVSTYCSAQDPIHEHTTVITAADATIIIDANDDDAITTMAGNDAGDIFHLPFDKSTLSVGPLFYLSCWHSHSSHVL